MNDAFPDIERQSPAKIKLLQDSLFSKAIKYAAEHSPFYKRRFRELKLSPETFTSTGGITRIPPTTKDDLHQNNWDFLCVPRSKIVEYTSTSGTLGKPVTIGLTQGDMNRLAYNEFISFACADGSENDLYQLTLTLDRQFMAGIAYYEGIRKLGAGIVRVGPGLPALQWETIQRLNSSVLVAVPSFLLKLIDHAKDNNIDLSVSPVKKIICIGENIRTEDLHLNILGKRITDAWPIKLYGTYASTEMQTAFTECGHGKGGHHHPELVYVELLDNNDYPVAAGSPGEVTITTFGIEGMPLIRYKTGDISVMFNTPCECGRTTIRLGPVLGRKQQMIKLKGTSIYPQGIFEILNQHRDIQNYVVEAFHGENATDELKLHLVVSHDLRGPLAATIKADFQSRLRVVPALTFSEPADVEKLQLSGGRKVMRFVDRRTSHIS